MSIKKSLSAAGRMANISPFHVMRILERAKQLDQQGAEIVHMEVGEPDFPTPEPLIEAGRKALGDGRTGYTPAVGIPELREAIAGYYQSQYGVAVSAKQIVITPGASGALQLVLAALVNPGDEVLLTDPGYPCNRNFVELFNGVPTPLPVSLATHYQPTSEQIVSACNPRTKALLLATPANPTGSVLSKRQLESFQQITCESGMALIVDEIYHGLVYEPAQHKSADGIYEQDVMGPVQTDTALSLNDISNVFVINSFSKYFGMTGWRLGWVIAPVDYVEILDRLAQNLFLCASTPAQYAALAAFEAETLAILEKRREAFRRRRDYLYPELTRLGFRIDEKPSGAFYIYANCAPFGADSYQFATDVLEKAGVAITPGIDFGQFEAEKHVRFAYTTSLEKLEEGVSRLEEFLTGMV